MEDMVDTSIKGIITIMASGVCGIFGGTIGAVGGVRMADWVKQKCMKPDTPFIAEYAITTGGYLATVSAAIITGAGSSVIAFNLLNNLR